ncbi:TorF family putative porin [Oceaniserpentilla sp. 4NH20-0058]|uniref:TorF family putative porin n=1 Tax=Oceaniserpentilla sp. 4NH20-0058 TaxID=3127660 RepID=UPI003109EB56
MKTLSKAVAMASLLSAGVMGAQVANAEVAFNAAVTTNYIWRGQTQTDNGFAIQGGADYADKSGVYAGVWGSNVDFGGDDNIEYDLYAGYGLEKNGLDLDFGFIAYNYDDAGNASNEIYAGVSKDAVSAKLSIDIENDNNMYLEGGYSMALPEDLGLDLHAGLALPDEGDNDIDLAATVGKSLEMFDVSATLSYTGADVEDDILFALTASKEF